MKVLIAPDSFKESMSAKEVCDTIEKAILYIDNSVEIIKVPMADGGEGTVDTLCSSLNGKIIYKNVEDPLQRIIKAKYAIANKTAIIEMASASGLELLSKNEKNPYYTSTYGTGELILDAIKNGAKDIIIGIGGSATNDAGVGMLMALGAKILDKNGNNIKKGAKYLKNIASIDISNVPKINITVACDVDNILTGPSGASYVFAKQKGATDEMIKILDNNLKHFANIVRNDIGKEIEYINGSGAAGGLGAALLLIGAKLQKGIDIVINTTKLEEKIKNCDLVITGEGCIDSQTKFGKTPYGISKIAKKYNKPIIAFAGKINDYDNVLNDCNFSAMFCITNELCDLETALKNGENNLYNTVKNVFKIIKISKLLK